MKTSHTPTVKRYVAAALLGLSLLAATALPSMAQTANGNPPQTPPQTVQPGPVYPGWGWTQPPAPGYGYGYGGWGCC